MINFNGRSVSNIIFNGNNIDTSNIRIINFNSGNVNSTLVLIALVTSAMH